MERVKSSIAAAAVAVVLLVSGGASLAAGFAGQEIVAQGEDEVTFTVRLPHYRLDTLLYDGIEYARPFATGLVSFAETGAPDLPVFSVLLAVPPGSEARLVSSAMAGESTIERVRVAPVPRIAAGGEGGSRFAVYSHEEAQEIYGSASVFPDPAVWLADRGRLRHQDVVRVFVSPFRYAPLESRLSVVREVTVTVAFRGGTLLRGGLVPEDAWEGVYRDALLNYEQGRRWRSAPARALRSAVVTNDRVKILIDTTGVYHIGYDTLAGLGFPENVPVDDVFLYQDRFTEGTPDKAEVVEYAIAISDSDQDGLLSPGDTITFFGQDFYDQYGRRGAEDYFFDKNVYWLSRCPGVHERIQSRSGLREGASPEVPTRFTAFIHEEEDLNFINFPPSGTEMDYYTWQRKQGDFPFSLPGLDSLFPSTLVAQFVSYYTQDESSMSALMGIFITSCKTPPTRIATLNIGVPSSSVRTLEIDADVLCNQGNVFRFESSISSNRTPGHQLDWFEVVYERKYEAHEDILAFDNGDMLGELEYRVRGFSESDIMVYDITDSLAPVRLDIAPEQVVEEGGAFTLAFRDSLAGPRKYFSFCASAGRVPGPQALSLLGPPILREATGEYLIVSHPDFTDALAPLIARREVQGYSVLLVTTDEIYDDFGNGAKSDVAIRRFAESAFHNGNAQFILLVGDANVDRRGVLLEPSGMQIPSDLDRVPSHNILLKDGGAVNREIRPSENWFAMLDGPNDRYPDIYLGRLSADDTAELDAMITKIATFEDDAGTDPWKKRLLFVSDDYYSTPRGDLSRRDSVCSISGDRAFERSCDSAAVIARDYAVVGIDTVKYYLRRCTKSHEPDRRALNLCVNTNSAVLYTRANCKADLLSLLDDGGLLLDFQGHSNMNVLTSEQVIEDNFSFHDVENLSNLTSPFIFLAFGCWTSDFQRQTEAAVFVGDAITEKFMKNPDGGACLTFASACADYINDNERFNPFVIRAIFTHLQGFDPQGNPVPARLLAGEALVTSLLRFGHVSYAERHVLLGDPAMAIDLGPPLLEVSADGTPVGGSYVYTGSDTLTLVAGIKDEEAIMSIDLDIVRDGISEAVPTDAYTVKALVDTDFTRSRAYEVTYDHVPYLGEYTVEIAGEDYVGKSSGVEVAVATGSARFYRDGEQLGQGAPLVLGQKLRIEIARPVAVSESEIQASVDSVAASEFDDYSVEMLDAEGKEWAISFMPSLERGDHTVTVSVQGLSANRDFEYVPARVGVFADDKALYDNDYISSTAEFEIVVEAGAGIDEGDLGVELDGEDLPVTFTADSAGVVFTASFGVDLDPGEHQVTVKVFDVSLSWTFRVAEDLLLRDVSVFPSPFSRETYFFYTLSRGAREVDLSIYAVSGRLIFEGDMPTTAGYNQYLWDGCDMALDRVANGTYLYRIVAKAGSRERESSGWVVKVE